MEESEGFNLIDVSFENDSLIASDDSSSTPTHLPQSSDANGVAGTDLSNECSEKLPQLFEIAEPETLKKTSKYNLRKSLAWDSAFFESPGFLDAEDISNIIDGAEGGRKHLLPGIDEDIRRSTDSLSTLVSENLTLESLEADLFEDIRASIQKSSKASGITTSNCKEAPKETGKVVKCSVKKVNVTSQKKIATNATSTRQTGGMLGAERILKKDSSCPVAIQPGLRNGNSTPSLAQSPKVMTKPETLSRKTTIRASLSANQIKSETCKSKVGPKETQVPKAAGLAGPRRSVPRPQSISKASCSASSGAVTKEVGRSSGNNGSNSTSTEKVHNSSLTSARTKIVSKPVIRPSSCSIPKASSKIPLRRKPSGKSGPSISLASSKICSSISPSSSISEWSSASSSTSSANQRFASRTSIDNNTSCSTVNERFSVGMSIDINSSRRSMDSDTTSNVCSDIQCSDDISDGNANQFIEVSGQDTKNISTQSGTLSRSTLMKPSGLRMPSPKIGFFDGAKSVVRTPNGCRQSQSHLPTGLPKAAIRSPVGSLKKTERNLIPVKKARASSNTVLDTSKSASTKPAQELLRASVNVHGASRNVASPKASSEVRSSNKGTGKPQPEITLTSANRELEGQNSGSPKPLQESASSGVAAEELHSNMDGPDCFKDEDVKIGKPDSTEHATANAPKAENDENLLINI